jgi:hypothetical protein
MKICEHCGRKQKKLNACSFANQWLCDKCYSDTLNFDLHGYEKVQHRIDRAEMKSVAGSIFGGS